MLRVMNIASFGALSDAGKLLLGSWLDKTGHHPWYSIQEKEIPYIEKGISMVKRVESLLNKEKIQRNLILRMQGGVK